MATNNEDHREACRRQHRVIGNYLAVQCWLRGADGLALNRDELEAFLGLQRFKRARVEWLLKDLRPWFEFREPFYKTRSPSSIHSLILSRKPLRPYLPSGSMTLEQRLNGMQSGAPTIQRYSSSDMPVAVPSEIEIVSELAVLAAGLQEPQKPKKKRKLPRRRV